jgi:DNA-directed RNA polymerase specialized sigma24 family protein
VNADSAYRTGAERSNPGPGGESADGWGRAAAYDAYADGLHTYALWSLRDHDAAVDALYCAFVIADRNVTQLRQPDLIQPWLYAILRRECAARTAGTHRAPAPVSGRRPAPPGAADLGGSLDQLERSLRRAEFHSLEWSEAEGLTAAHREILELTIRHGLDSRGLGLVLGLNQAGPRDPARTGAGGRHGAGGGPVGAQGFGVLADAWRELERSLAAVAVARGLREADPGTQHCARLAELIFGWTGRLNAVLRGPLTDHVDHCSRCQNYLHTVVGTPAAPTILPFVAAPRSLRDLLLNELNDSTVAARAGVDHLAIAARAARFTPEGFPALADPVQHRRSSHRRVPKRGAVRAVGRAVVGVEAGGAGSVDGPVRPDGGMGSGAGARETGVSESAAAGSPGTGLAGSGPMAPGFGAAGISSDGSRLSGPAASGPGPAEFPAAGSSPGGLRPSGAAASGSGTAGFSSSGSGSGAVASIPAAPGPGGLAGGSVGGPSRVGSSSDGSRHPGSAGLGAAAGSGPAGFPADGLPRSGSRRSGAVAPGPGGPASVPAAEASSFGSSSADARPSGPAAFEAAPEAAPPDGPAGPSPFGSSAGGARLSESTSAGSEPSGSMPPGHAAAGSPSPRSSSCGNSPTRPLLLRKPVPPGPALHVVTPDPGHSRSGLGLGDADSAGPGPAGPDDDLDLPGLYRSPGSWADRVLPTQFEQDEVDTVETAISRSGSARHSWSSGGQFVDTASGRFAATAPEPAAPLPSFTDPTAPWAEPVTSGPSTAPLPRFADPAAPWASGQSPAADFGRAASGNGSRAADQAAADRWSAAGSGAAASGSGSRAAGQTADGRTEHPAMAAFRAAPRSAGDQVSPRSGDPVRRRGTDQAGRAGVDSASRRNGQPLARRAGESAGRSGTVPAPAGSSALAPGPAPGSGSAAGKGPASVGGNPDSGPAAAGRVRARHKSKPVRQAVLSAVALGAVGAVAAASAAVLGLTSSDHPNQALDAPPADPVVTIGSGDGGLAVTMTPSAGSTATAQATNPARPGPTLTGSVITTTPPVKPGPTPTSDPGAYFFVSVNQRSADPDSVSILLRNSGTAPISWSAVPQNSWITLSQSSGRIPGGGSVTITADASSAAPAGLWTSQVDFTPGNQAVVLHGGTPTAPPTSPTSPPTTTSPPTAAPTTTPPTTPPTTTAPPSASPTQTPSSTASDVQTSAPTASAAPTTRPPTHRRP